MISIFVIIALICYSAAVFFIGVLFAKRNPKYMDKIDKAYMKGRDDVEAEVREKLKEAERIIRSKTGSIEIPKIGNIRKYLLRFGLPLASLIGIIAILKPENVILVLYKACLILVGLILCETIWLVSYKPVFGKIEEMKRYEMRSVLIFRGVLYLAVILGITWGL